MQKNAWLILIGLSGIWGSSFILMKKGLDVFSYEQVAALRMLIAGLCLLPFVFKYLKLLIGKDYKFMLASGALGNGIPAFLFTKAETGISSALAGMLNSLTPLFTLIIGVSFFNSELKKNTIVGVLIGLCGAVLLLINKGGHSANPWFSILIVIATVCYGLSVNIIRSNLHHIDSIAISSIAVLSMAIPCGIYLLLGTDFVTRMVTIPGAWLSLGYIFILGAIGTGLSTILYNVLVKQSGAMFAASTTYFIPIVAVLWGLSDGEQLSVYHIAGLGTILCGVWLVNKKSKS